MQERTALSIAEAARSIGVGRSTLYAIIKSGRLPVRKLGSRTLVLKIDLEAFVADLPKGNCDTDLEGE